MHSLEKVDAIASTPVKLSAELADERGASLFPDLILPGEAERESLWNLMETLFPVYRSLLGPGFKQSLDIIKDRIPISVAEFATGEQVLDWTIPQEFKVNAAWVEDPDGNRIIDFAEHPYAVWIYSRPFEGEVDRDELLQHVTTDPNLPDVFPMRQSYYRDAWGFSCPHNRLQRMKPGRYKVKIDTELYDGVLRIGEMYLPGEVEEEILISSYLCHPLGANDNLSGVVVAVELFRLLQKLPKRHYSYRLALWPETIGAMTYIAKYPDRIAKTVGGYQFGICGDDKPVGIDRTKADGTIIDRAFHHAMKLVTGEIVSRPFNIYGTDACHFNSIGVDVPTANISRAGSRPGGYAEYHSSADDLSLVSADNLFETLLTGWVALMTIERTHVYRGTYTASPFMSRHGVYPYQHGAGVGGRASIIGDAYYAIIPHADGKQDLLEIAERCEMPIFAFNECVEQFLKAGLLTACDG
ncbi:MAG: DUF4910 domain-containing protein [Alphaproteobacteria bacterium]